MHGMFSGYLLIFIPSFLLSCYLRYLFGDALSDHLEKDISQWSVQSLFAITINSMTFIFKCPVHCFYSWMISLFLLFFQPCNDSTPVAITAMSVVQLGRENWFSDMFVCF